MKEAIERVIANYEKRMESMQMILGVSTSDDQRKSVLGKLHVLNGVVHDLKAVLSDGENDNRRIQSTPESG